MTNLHGMAMSWSPTRTITHNAALLLLAIHRHNSIPLQNLKQVIKAIFFAGLEVVAISYQAYLLQILSPHDLVATTAITLASTALSITLPYIIKGMQKTVGYLSDEQKFEKLIEEQGMPEHTLI